MTINEKKILKKEIKDLHILNIEQVFLISKYILDAYIKSIITFGVNSVVTKENISLLYKYIRIYRREKNIYNYLLKHSIQIDLDECFNLIDLLDNLNSKTIDYFYSSIDDIIDACTLKEEIRIVHKKRFFSTLDETNEYEFITKCLTIQYCDVVEYLNYPNDFWNYIEEKIVECDSTISHSVLTNYDNNELKDIKVYIPKIKSKETAIKVLYELKYSYCLYNLLNNYVDEKNIFDNIDIEDNEFKHYVINKKM